MVKKSFKEKVDFIKKTRLNNYRESLRLEGINLSVKSNGKTRDELISYYMNKK